MLSATGTESPLAWKEPEEEKKLPDYRAALQSTCSSEALTGQASPVQRELPHTMKLLHSFILKNILHFNKKGFMSGNSHLQTLKCFCLDLDLRMSYEEVREVFVTKCHYLQKNIDRLCLLVKNSEPKLLPVFLIAANPCQGNMTTLA